MTTSNEHNNAPSVPQGEPVAWMVHGNYTRQPFGMLSSAEAYMRGLLKSDPDGGYHIRPLRYTTPAPAPAQEIDKSVADAEIKAMYVESQGSDKGWLGIEGSYFIGGVVAARKQKAAPAPAQDEPFGHFRAEPFGWTDCAKDDEGAIALYEHPMTNPWRDAVIEQLESWHIYVPAIHDNSPRLAIKALVNMECKAALDPAVSSEAAALAAQGVQAPAPAQLTDEERADMACAVAAICTGASSRTVAATAIEWTERALRAKGGKHV